MKIEIPNANFSTSKRRAEFAKTLAMIVCGDFEPYIVNNDYEFVLDQGNDWRILFFEDRISTVRISYRYQCAGVQAKEALFSLLAFRFDAKLVGEGE